ncbi:MAG: uL30 family ribosomal protein [Candidatus Woesearchaeota archaeon]
MTEKNIAIIRIRGNTGVRKSIRDTLDMLNLHNQHNCVIVKETPVTMGMIKKVQHFVTFGEVSEETISLLEKRGKKGKSYRLSPPVKGFERKGIKVPFTKGGALGQRGDKINDLIKRMIA